MTVRRVNPRRVKKGGGRKSRRWLRLVGPGAAVLALVVLSALLYWLQQPDQQDDAYLSPVSTHDIGARTLADRVRADGVAVDRRTKSSDALTSAEDGSATLLITTPSMVHQDYLRMLKLLPSTVHVVLVEPDGGTLARGLLPIRPAAQSYATETAAPGCAFEPVRATGRAAVHRTRFGPVDTAQGVELARCYDDALVVLRRGGADITVVGSADPFRNDRIGEFANANLAVGLLTRESRLIWLDLHHRESAPAVDNDPGLTGAPAAPPSLRPPASGQPGDPDFPMAGGGGPEGPPSGGQSAPGQNDAGQGRPANPLWSFFPPWVYVTVALLVVAALAYAAARARRLGAPVDEPLPVRVRATETVVGRGRLYQRAQARGPALQTLRAAAVGRLARVLKLGVEPDRTILVDTVAAQSGWSPEAVGTTLFGPEPVDDAELVQAAVSLESLLNAATAAKGDHR